MVKTAALVLAGGRGARAGGGIPKQYREIAGGPLLRATLRVFVDHPAIDMVGVVIHPDDVALYENAAADMALLPAVFGGATRQESTFKGLRSLSDFVPNNVLIHDGARPFVSADTISRVVDALASDIAVLAAVPVTDTIKREKTFGTVGKTVDREGLWRAQTPQAFHYDAIMAAHEQFSGQSLTDDAAVAEAAGHLVRLVEGNEDNFKVTAPEDFKRARDKMNYIRAGPMGETRVGSGFDVHRFEPGDAIMLCGVKVPHNQGLAGHSDADVGMHALTDAILGAICESDIGSYFPPSDPQWNNANSEIFLAKAAELVAERGGSILHVDVTLICESPKIGPHRDSMRSRLSDILALDMGRVSVKATTTERLGFTGRGEGIAGQATATILLK
jgi:2-C-methyl-D-erythritol 4-phosphate cytidylyltransferase / 2-C-methyl-D-erythritol 2,4-cyclodiphosphate synthase